MQQSPANFNRTARRGRVFTIPTFSPGTSCGVLVYFTYQLYKNIQKNTALHWVFGVVWFCLNTKNTDNWRYNRTYRGYNSITPFIASRGPPGHPCSYKNTTRAEPWNQGCKGWKLMLETKKQIRGPPFLKLHAIDIVSEVSIPLHGKQKNHQTKNTKP